MIHQCPKQDCNIIPCYEHIILNDPNYNFSQLKWQIDCNCDYSLSNDKKIGLCSSFQGAIASYLCSGNTNPTLTPNGIKFLKQMNANKRDRNNQM